ncbi:hypothetical protein [Natronosalvus vescus]|uniref:hypothetical protein n=1 Tax=Natronosalvus vescus TaxID=2953881 RepID=UPI002090B84D|nr:hypothetical protein [Natronosalvus vescus]
MARESATKLIDYLEEEFPEALRSVGYYTSEESEFLFVRDDVDSTYDCGELQRIFRDYKLEALDAAHQESLYEHGSLLATARFFDRATELHFVHGETEGIITAIDAGSVDDVRGLVCECATVVDTSE